MKLIESIIVTTGRITLAAAYAAAGLAVTGTLALVGYVLTLTR